MAFINQNDGICLSQNGISNFNPCGPIIKEEDPITYVFTESNLTINTDNGCDGAKFGCNFERKVVSSGIVNITNTCTLPIEITGFVNSDPARFSLFDYPKYKNQGSIYSLENTSELPIKLNPMDSLSIPTFFHPLLSELEQGRAGEIEDVHNQKYEIDKFGAKIDIYPGFPISNCSTDENSCDSFFILTGQFLCDEAPDLDWMNNIENYTPSLESGESFNEIEVSTCIKTTPGLKVGVDSWANEQELIDRLNKAAIAYLEFITNGQKSLQVLYSHVGMYGALKGLIELSGSQSFTSIQDLLSATLTEINVSYTNESLVTNMKVSYDMNKRATTVDGDIFNGMMFNVSKESGRHEARNQTIFFREQISDGSISIFTAEVGNYFEQDFCESFFANINVI